VSFSVVTAMAPAALLLLPACGTVISPSPWARDWLLDATIDQVNENLDWPYWVAPLVLALSPELWLLDKWGHGAAARSKTAEGVETSVYLYPRQQGFAHAGYARPKYWRPVADAIRAAIERATINETQTKRMTL
jgi:hypothetical protein